MLNAAFKCTTLLFLSSYSYVLQFTLFSDILFTISRVHLLKKKNKDNGHFMFYFVSMFI